MELFGIIFSVPVAFVASTIYCFFLAQFVAPYEPARHGFWRMGAFVLLAFVLEVLLLVTLGAVRTRAVIGPAFYPAHLLLFFTGTPALANVLVLRRHSARARPWYFAIPVCTAFAFVLVLLQYAVSEALYGVEGEGGLYS